MAAVDWLCFVPASVAVVLAPGPGSMFVAKTAAATGVRSGHRALLGLMAGDLCLIALSLGGLSALFAAYPGLFHAVRLIGAGYLVLLGTQMLLAKRGGSTEPMAAPAAPFRRALAITLLNPKAVLFFMAFFPLFLRGADGELLSAYAAMTAVFMAISAAYLAVLVRLADRLARTFSRREGLLRLARRACGCAFVGFGVKVGASAA